MVWKMYGVIGIEEGFVVWGEDNGEKERLFDEVGFCVCCVLERVEYWGKVGKRSWWWYEDLGG